ncbi:MAG: ADP-ribose pyrophosphatase [Bacteroidia bacterium]|nr:MAG: ADP-ribose pyrophosphatase [Bacteroidia bacterium]
MKGPKTVKSERLYTGKVFNLIVDEVEYPSGNRAIREVADHPGGAVVIPLITPSTVLLIRQFRYPIKGVLYEAPAGKLDPHEDPADCARRELEEETGYRAQHVEKLTAIYTSPGFCNERLHLFLATGLTKTSEGPRLEEGEEGLTIELVLMEEAIRMIERGDIVDAKTVCGLFLALARLRKANHE